MSNPSTNINDSHELGGKFYVCVFSTKNVFENEFRRKAVTADEWRFLRGTIVGILSADSVREHSLHERSTLETNIIYKS